MTHRLRIAFPGAIACLYAIGNGRPSRAALHDGEQGNQPSEARLMRKLIFQDLTPLFWRLIFRRLGYPLSRLKEIEMLPRPDLFRAMWRGILTVLMISLGFALCVPIALSQTESSEPWQQKLPKPPITVTEMHVAAYSSGLDRGRTTATHGFNEISS
jgi:hypothetical protein